MNVLLIDDEEICHFLYKKVLSFLGGVDTVHSAFNGQEAIEFLANNPDGAKLLDLIIVDLNMPVMDGFEFLENFKNLNKHILSSAKLVMASSSLKKTDRDTALEFGADFFVAKPLTPEFLVEIFNHKAIATQNESIPREFV